MTQVMEAITGQASLGNRGQPSPAVEVAMPWWGAHWAGEHERLVIVGVEAVEMIGQLRHLLEE